MPMKLSHQGCCIQAIKVVAMATNEVQSDSATVSTVKDEAMKIKLHWGKVSYAYNLSVVPMNFNFQMASVPGLEEFASKALEKCDARWTKHFDHDASTLVEVFAICISQLFFIFPLSFWTTPLTSQHGSLYGVKKLPNCFYNTLTETKTSSGRSLDGSS